MWGITGYAMIQKAWFRCPIIDVDWSHKIIRTIISNHVFVFSSSKKEQASGCGTSTLSAVYRASTFRCQERTCYGGFLSCHRWLFELWIIHAPLVSWLCLVPILSTRKEDYGCVTPINIQGHAFKLTYCKCQWTIYITSPDDKTWWCNSQIQHRLWKW